MKKLASVRLRLRAVAPIALKAAPSVARDAIGVTGGLLVVHGVDMISAPFAAIVAGGMMILVALRLARGS